MASFVSWQLPHPMDTLILLSQHIDAEGITHSLCRLPAPINWPFRTYTNGDCSQFYETNQLVTKVRVSYFIDELSISHAVVVPFDESDQENRDGSIFMDGLPSLMGLLGHPNFTPALVAK